MPHQHLCPAIARGGSKLSPPSQIQHFNAHFIESSFLHQRNKDVSQARATNACVQEYPMQVT